MEEQLVEELRPKAFDVAYRMLGSASEAEDVVQEGLLRLHRELEDGAEIRSPEAFLTTVVTRLALDELRSARARREVYTGEWLPEPILTAESEDPARHAEIAESLSTGMLMVLETLTPEQRAVFLLREVFDYPHERIAEIIGRSPDSVRQLAVRARRQVGQARAHFETSREQRDRLTDRFFDAFEEGNVADLEALLASDVSLHGDGGGKAPALAKPLSGRSRVAKALGAWKRLAERAGGLTLRRAELNGGPGAVALDPEGRILSAMTLAVGDGEITAVNSVRESRQAPPPRPGRRPRRAAAARGELEGLIPHPTAG